MTQAPSLRSLLLRPVLVVALVGLLPVLGAARFRPDIVAMGLLWAGFCRLGAARWFGEARPLAAAAAPSRLYRVRAAGAEVLAVVLGCVGIVFLRAWDLWLPLALIPAPMLLADAASARLRFRFHSAYARFPALTVLICLAVTVGAYGSWIDTGAPALTDDFLYPLRANEAPSPLHADEREQAVRIVRATLNGEPPPAGAGRLAEPHGERVWVTLFRRSPKDRWVRGAGTDGTLADQLVAAAQAAKELAIQRRWSGDWQHARIQIDLEGPGQRLRWRWWRGALDAALVAVGGERLPWRFEQYDDEAGIDGFRLSVGGVEATVLPADPLIDGWFTPRNLKQRFRVDNWNRTLEELVKRGPFDAARPWPRGGTLTNFSTYSFAQPDPATSRTVELVRGNVLFEGELDEARLLEGIAAAGEWLLGTVEADGRFDYEYFPTRDSHGRGYNEVRHAGSVYGLFHLARLAETEPSLAPRRSAYLDAGARALDRVYGMLAPLPEGPDGAVAFTEQRGRRARIDAGAQALTLLSFLERPAAASTADPALATRLQRPGDEALMAGLARTLGALVDERGWVYKDWDAAREGAEMKRQPLYYPGELMLALVRYHQATDDPDALAVAKRVGKAQIAYAQRPFEIPDHWVMQALDLLDLLDPDDAAWRSAAYAMGREYTSEQFPPQRAHAPDYRGAYRRDMEIARTTRAASRGEAIGGVARIARRRGDPPDRWERSLIEGARHLLEQQYTPDNSFTFPEPTEALGAIRMGLIDNHCRIDNNQHGLVALSAALDAMRRRETR